MYCRSQSSGAGDQCYPNLLLPSNHGRTSAATWLGVPTSHTSPVAWSGLRGFVTNVSKARWDFSKDQNYVAQSGSLSQVLPNRSLISSLGIEHRLLQEHWWGMAGRCHRRARLAPTNANEALLEAKNKTFKLQHSQRSMIQVPLLPILIWWSYSVHLCLPAVSSITCNRGFQYSPYPLALSGQLHTRKARTFSEEMRQAVIIVVQKASSSARSQGMPSKIIPGWHRTIAQASFQTKNEFQLNLACKLRPGKTCLNTKLQPATFRTWFTVRWQVWYLSLGGLRADCRWYTTPSPALQIVKR